jgi:Domain of unknown function (DUF4326)
MRRETAAVSAAADPGPADRHVASLAPKRVQLSRAKGWRMPPNTVNVARPGLWGNPFTVSRWRDVRSCIALFTDLMYGVWNPKTSEHLPDAWTGYDEHQAFIKRMRARRGCFPQEVVHELRGKNLACWCAVEAPCHADVLLQLANQVNGIECSSNAGAAAATSAPPCTSTGATT